MLGEDLGLLLHGDVFVMFMSIYRYIFSDAYCSDVKFTESSVHNLECRL